MFFDLPQEQSSIIKVIGIGGGGCNAVNHMFRQGIKDVNFIICNTDAQALETSPVPNRIQLGPELTRGRGAGAVPDKGQAATIESVREIKELLERNTEMVFITAGMGGGTGTGGAPVVAKIAREMGILTVGIVTLPFSWEGPKRVQQAKKGISELQQHVDSIIVIVNDKIREVFGDLPFSAAFSKADDVLATAARGIAEIITRPGYVNVDFEDVKTVLTGSGVAIMGIGQASGENRAIDAVEIALSSPLLNDSDISGAREVLLNITSGRREVRMDEISEINEYVQEAAGADSNIIWGNCIDENLEDDLIVTVIATGFDQEEKRVALVADPPSRKVVSLQENNPAKAEPQKSAEPDSIEPYVRLSGSPEGKRIEPFSTQSLNSGANHSGQQKHSDPESEVLPFAYSLDDDMAQEPERPSRPAASHVDHETIGSHRRFTPIEDTQSETEAVDPAQISLPFHEEQPVTLPSSQARGNHIQTPVGEEELDWTEEMEEELLINDLDDDIIFGEDEDADMEGPQNPNEISWTLNKSTDKPSKPVSEIQNPANVPPSIPVSKDNISVRPAQQAPVAKAGSPEKESLRTAAIKPGLNVGKTVYPDGEWAKPPMVAGKPIVSDASSSLPPIVPGRPVDDNAKPIPPAGTSADSDAAFPSRPAPRDHQVPRNPAQQGIIRSVPPSAAQPPRIGQPGQDGPDQQRINEDRKQRLRNMSFRPTGRLSTDEYESMPAYMRRQTQLNDIPHSSEQKISEMQIGHGENMITHKPNGYIHNPID